MKRIIILILLLTFNIIDSDILDSQGIDKEMEKEMFNRVEYEMNRERVRLIAEMIDHIEREAEINIPDYVNIAYVRYLYNKSIELNLPIRYVFRLVNIESRFRYDAKSGVGANGFMQLMPRTESLYMNRLNLTHCNMDDNMKNITIGLHALSDLSKIFEHRKNKWELVLASYNAGISRVYKYNGIPPIKETQKYVNYILRERGYGTKINI
jgi:soluble lytic murein transglycosylase-like protein